VQTLQEWLTPFKDYLTNQSIQNPLDIARQYIDGFLHEIGKERRGKPLSPTSVFGFTKDVQAFINFVADTLAPEDCGNPVGKLPCKQPQVTIHPLSQEQIEILIAVSGIFGPNTNRKSSG
jgi:site-specific recombinase XerD